MSAGVWWLGGVRPENTPTRRLVGGAALVARWARLETPDEQIAALEAGYQRPRELVELFRARSSAEHWTWHDDFGAPPHGPRPWQVGGPRAAEMVVNVLLPLGYAVGRSTDRPELAAAALLAYRAMPTGPWNRISRAMAAQLFGSAGARHCRGAARQQGLLSLFKQFCWERRCDACPAGERRRAQTAMRMPSC